MARVETNRLRRGGVYSVAVRSLCEFTARAGDLSSRFTPAPSAQQGIAGHLIAASRRGSGYQRELTLRGQHGLLVVCGRADGYDPAKNRLEEFKTHRGDVKRVSANQRHLHWAQLKIYGALLCAERGLTELELALVYFDIGSEQETLLLDKATAPELQRHFESQCDLFSSWATRETRHRELRDGFLLTLRFPHAQLHRGQRQMAEAIFKAAMRSRSLMVEAPTGIGKTLGTLFPLLKAAGRQQLDKIVLLVAKTSGRALALDTLRSLLNQAGEPRNSPEIPRLRVLEMVAKESACVFPGRPCEADSCPLAKGFYDRLPAARIAAGGHAILDRETMRSVASETSVCPYYLSVEMARWCDVVVGDYAYFFDTTALLHGLTVQNSWRVGLLVDESHNLLSRGRAMYTAMLVPNVLDAAMLQAPPRVATELKRVQLIWRALLREEASLYYVETAIPENLVARLRAAAAAIADELVESDAPLPEPVLEFYFDALHFCRIAEAFAEHSLFDVTRSADAATLCIRNVNPAPFLAPRFAVCATAVVFSATLSPGEYYRRLLGVPTDAAFMSVESPFHETQLNVHVQQRISTRYRDRRHSLEPIARVIARQYQSRPGNYLAFFSSFEYLAAALTRFMSLFPEIRVWEQRRRMDESSRRAFLGHFMSAEPGVGFAVLGGVFAEGVDLPGDRLIGAFIATLGLPQVNEVNAQIERRMQTLFDAGYEYTYLYPGLQKVIQAAGRVIRTVTDSGTVHLIDDRYMKPEVQRLLPRWWRLQCN